MAPSSTLCLLLASFFLTLLISASSALPVNMNSDCTNCTTTPPPPPAQNNCSDCTGDEGDHPYCTSCFDAITDLYTGLTVLEKIVQPLNTTGKFRKFLKSAIRNKTGRTFLCDILINEEIMPECWKSDLEYLCHQSELYELTRQAYYSLVAYITNFDDREWLQRQPQPSSGSGADFLACVIIDNNRPEDC